MYNNVGLATTKGSGTSGHVQHNRAILYKKNHTKKVNQSNPIHCQSNKEILEHTKKREIEVKCLELSDKLGKQGCRQEEIDIEVGIYRKILIEKYTTTQENSGKFVKSAEDQLDKNAKLKNAFGIE